MEEDTTSKVSNYRRRILINVAAFSETSDCSNTSCDGGSSSKRPKLASTRFKGVVAQPNGNWGAQIYANHQRVWLGTFKSEQEAAMAYDSASINLQSGDSHRNFPWSERNVEEPSFQSQYTADKILNMIKDGSYRSKFDRFRTRNCQKLGTSIGNNNDNDCVQLFHKELTPSDVGKLNRLVIPKKFAVKFFPYIDIINGGVVDDVEIVFYDTMRRMWKFRYCYWKSSQSFVFTRGWNRFVKEKRLKEKDVVRFYACGHGGDTVFLIDASHCSRQNVGDAEMELELNLGVEFNCRSSMAGGPKRTHGARSSDEQINKGGFRLFGVNIHENTH